MCAASHLALWLINIQLKSRRMYYKSLLISKPRFLRACWLLNRASQDKREKKKKKEHNKRTSQTEAQSRKMSTNGFLMNIQQRAALSPQ